MKQKIIATSDLHGQLPYIEEEFDLLLICGDICPAHDHYYAFQSEWIENEFVEWVNGINFKDEYSKVILIPGNHDFVFEKWHKDYYKRIEKLTKHRLKILVDDEFDYFGIKIYGTPWCKQFGHWAYMLNDEKLKMVYENIPENIDILMTHDAPSLNDFGKILMGKWEGEDASNKALGESISEKKPRIALHGHIHSSRHEFKEYDGIWMSCVSYLDEYYNPAYPMLMFEYDPETKEVFYNE